MSNDSVECGLGVKWIYLRNNALSPVIVQKKAGYITSLSFSSVGQCRVRLKENDALLQNRQ